ncbi:hypothetical protein GCM10025867_47170 (plasmid) [Frondihabitans sucicola]|uniref:Uncharacterized protein n=1 Tax=Frondihabitans sucicola TaxID=1268041 RepID=A0ABM8GVT3_9MICO|nr:hypothetical protein [Frondihabitans sucicola]BDZ52476.1 hypothetical protein GCM10025867_47170 [Frondihabitans sucicola]
MDMPTGNQTFIAYAKAPSSEVMEDGSVLEVRPQIYVRFYSAIKIKEIVDGGRGGEGKTVAVHFDPESVGLTSGFTGYLNPEDPAVPYLRGKWEAGQSVQIGIESIRKKKSSKTKEPLPLLVPINALRGANANGSGADMGTSGANIRNVIALVDGRPVSTTESDISEWALLANNKEGGLAPQGWKPLVAGGENWHTLGAIQRDVDAPQHGSTVVDNTEILQAIAKLGGDLLAVLERTGGGNPADTGANIGRRIQPGVFNEGKQWDMRTSDGRFNLGSYLAGRYRLAFADARKLATTSGHTEIDDDTLWTVVEALLTATDYVQAQGYGHDTPIDRTAPSYAEAAQWVKLTAEDMITDGQALPLDAEPLTEWAQIVASAAVDRFISVRERAGAYLQARGARPARPSAQVPSEPAPNPAFSPVVLKGLADSVALFAGNANALTNLATGIKEKGQTDVKLAVRRVDGKVQVVVAETLQDANGWHLDTAINILRVLHTEASNQAAPQSAPQAPEVAEQVSAAPAPQAPVAEAPAAPTRSNSPIAKSVVTQLAGAVVIDAIGQAFEQAKRSNVLDELVAARVDEAGAVSFAPWGPRGSPKCRLLRRSTR